MNVPSSSVKKALVTAETATEVLGTIEPATSGSLSENRVGIERAFDVLRHHTVHTKGYVMTALQFIEEFGNDSDKAILTGLLQEKNQSIPAPPSKKKVAKRR